MGGDDSVLDAAGYLGAIRNYAASAHEFTEAMNRFGLLMEEVADVVTEEDEVEEAMTGNPLWGSF